MQQVKKQNDSLANVKPLYTGVVIVERSLSDDKIDRSLTIFQRDPIDHQDLNDLSMIVQ